MTVPELNGVRADMNEGQATCHAVITDQFRPEEGVYFEDLFYMQREDIHDRIWTVWKIAGLDEPKYVTTVNVRAFASAREFADYLITLAENEYGDDE